MSNSDQNRDGGVSPRLSMTFGFEVEMLVASAGTLPAICGKQPPWDDPHPGDGRWCAIDNSRGSAQYTTEEAVAEMLLKAGIENTWIEDSLATHRPSGASQASRMMLPKVDMKYHNWRVMPESSLSVEEWIATDPVLGRYSWSSAEIASAVFNVWARSPDVWIAPRQAQAKQIADVCRTLATNLRIRLSTSCGLHIHLGLGGNSIPGDTVRRFVSVMWLIEDAVLSLCASWRADNTWAQPITKASLLASGSDEGRALRRSTENIPVDLYALRMFFGDSVWNTLTRVQKQHLQLIWSLPLSGNNNNNLVEAITTTTWSSRGTVAVRGAILGRDSSQHSNVANTIEIRYASATLVARELLSWTNLFIRLFQLCNWYHETNAVRLSTLVHGVLSAHGSGRHAGHELLRQIGLGDDVGLWEAAGKRWAREDDHDQVRMNPFVDG